MQRCCTFIRFPSAFFQQNSAKSPPLSGAASRPISSTLATGQTRCDASFHHTLEHVPENIAIPEALVAGARIHSIEMAVWPPYG